MFALAVAGVVFVTWAAGGCGSWYGIAVLPLLCLKLAGSFWYQPIQTVNAIEHRVAAVLSFYNEDPEAFRQCLDSIKTQTRPPDEIWVIDDGSSDDYCFKIAHDMSRNTPQMIIRRFDTNRGKRHAQSIAFGETRCDIVMTLDSDTVLDSAAIAEGLKPFSDPNVKAVTGSVRALNRSTNLLTPLIDLRYANAFLFERAAQSTIGSVLCCCGCLSFFRTQVVRHHLEDFVTQSLFGVPVQYGDDRRFTQYSLLHGKVLFQDSAIAYTLVPESLSHFRRQQLRWNKSFLRETVWAIRHLNFRQYAFWVSLIEFVAWVIFTVSLLTSFYFRPLIAGQIVPWYYLAFGILLAYGRNVRYFRTAWPVPP